MARKWRASSYRKHSFHPFDIGMKCKAAQDYPSQNSQKTSLTASENLLTG